MSETVQASNGTMLPIESIPQIFTYAGGFLSTIDVVYESISYQQVFLNDGLNITYVSNWNPVTAGSTIMTDESNVVLLTEENYPIYSE